MGIEYKKTSKHKIIKLDGPLLDNVTQISIINRMCHKNHTARWQLPHTSV